MDKYKDFILAQLSVIKDAGFKKVKFTFYQPLGANPSVSEMIKKVKDIS